MLVDVAHVEHLQAEPANRFLFVGVDAADADEVDVLGRDRAGSPLHPTSALRAMAQQAGHRHAMQVAGGADGFGVDVGVGVQPDHAQMLARVAAMPGHGADRADGQAMVAPHEQRRLARGQHGGHPIEDRAVPGHDLVQVAHAALGLGPGRGRAGQVAMIDHVEIVGAQSLEQAGHPQRIRAHAGAPHTGAHVGGRADQRNGFHAGHCEAITVFLQLLRVAGFSG